ncbi:MAG: 4-alpha-glucanotransferase, partial [Candidatus Cloacimonadales bacterium]
KKNLYEYLKHIRGRQDIVINLRTIAYDMIELAYSSSCVVAIIPMQDILELGSEYRMNRPGIANGNWGMRLPQDYLGNIDGEKLNGLRGKYNR